MTLPYFNSNRDAALFWYRYGLKSIPIVPGEKRPALPYSPWLDNVSAESVERHWRKHPDHDVGCVLTDGIVVLDADTPEAEAALWTLEREHGAPPLLRVRTRRGVHHYFQVEPSTCVRLDSHDTSRHPDRIDVRAGRSSMVLPPSGPRVIEALDAASAEELATVGQDFIDAVFKHNGRNPPRPPATRSSEPIVAEEGDLRTLALLLKHVDPDCGYEDWVHVLMALFHETGGSDEGLELADAWSSGGAKYKGTREIETKWRSFSPGAANPITIASLISLARDGGADTDDIMTEPFEPCDFEIIEVDGSSQMNAIVLKHPFDRYSLRGRAGEMALEAEASVPLLGDIALKGQATVIYAAPNTGKTLLTLYLMIQAIKLGRVDPAQIFYLNLDDTLNGLIEKLKIADELGFNMLSEGFGGSENFRVRDFFAACGRSSTRADRRTRYSSWIR